LCFCDALFCSFSRFVERPRLDLPDALTRHVKFRREVCQISRLEDATFAVVEYIDCAGQRLMLAIFLVVLLVTTASGEGD
jgi:hypothetical protein